MVIQYIGFQPQHRGRDYSYRVVDPKAEPREFVLTIPARAFVERHVPYQDAAAICYQKLQRELASETAEKPIPRRLTISDEELETYRAKYRPAKRRGG